MAIKKVLIFTTSEGHLSIAKAVASYLKKNNYQVNIVFREEIGLYGYKFLYKHFPNLFSLFFALSKTQPVHSLLHFFSFIEHRRFVDRHIQKLQPNIIINTSFGYTSSIKNAVKEYRCTSVNIIPNPRTFFRQDISKVGINLVFDEKTKKDVIQTLQSAKVVVSGWFVQEDFEQPYDKVTVRKQLKLAEDKTILLFVAGSEGTLKIKSIVSKLLNLTGVQIIVACGKNENLYKQIEQMSHGISTAVKPISFTNQIYKYMQAADLVIGKAGPNMIFESIATYTPFFATTHISGLEDGNLQIIEQYEIGIVEKDPEIAAQKIIHLVTHPLELKQFTPAVKKLAEYNKDQRNELLKYLQELN